MVAGQRKEDVMEQRGVLLKGIARVLNAGGCALLNIYDAATSIKTSKTSVLPGAKEGLQAQLAESEKRMEKIKQRILAIEDEEKAAREAATKSAETKTEPVADAGEPAASAAPAAAEGSTDAVAEEAKEIVAAAAETPEHELQKDTAEPEAPVAGEVATDAVTEEVSERVAEAAETPEHELQKDTAESEAPVAVEVATDAVTQENTATEVFEKMLKSDLLKLCLEKGIEADKKMTKPEIIALILGRS